MTFTARMGVLIVIDVLLRLYSCGRPNQVNGIHHWVNGLAQKDTFAEDNLGGEYECDPLLLCPRIALLGPSFEVILLFADLVVAPSDYAGRQVRQFVQKLGLEL